MHRKCLSATLHRWDLLFAYFCGSSLRKKKTLPALNFDRKKTNWLSNCLCTPQSNFKGPSQKVRVCSPEKLVLVIFDAKCGGSIHLWLRRFSLNLTSVYGNFTSTYNLGSFSKLHGAAWLYWKMSKTFEMLRLLLGFGGDKGLCGRHIVALLCYHQPRVWRGGRDLLEKLQLNISRWQELLVGHIPKPLIMKRFAVQGFLFTV